MRRAWRWLEVVRRRRVQKSVVKERGWVGEKGEKDKSRCEREEGKREREALAVESLGRSSKGGRGVLSAKMFQLSAA